MVDKEIMVEMIVVSDPISSSAEYLANKMEAKVKVGIMDWTNSV